MDLSDQCDVVAPEVTSRTLYEEVVEVYDVGMAGQHTTLHSIPFLMRHHAPDQEILHRAGIDLIETILFDDLLQQPGELLTLRRFIFVAPADDG